MAITSKPLSIANVVNGKSPFTHYAWAWNQLGTDRFTQLYPNDNIILNSQFKTDTAGWLTGNATISVDTTNKLDGLNSMKAVLQADDTAGTKSRAYYRYNGQTPLDVSGSIWMKADKAVQVGIRTDDGQTTAKYNVTTEWQRFELPKRGYMILLWAFSACTLWVAKPKVELSTVSTIYTPAPSEDPANAYPLYQGIYTDNSATGSTNPQKYAWQRIKGENGQNGQDGQNGENAPHVTAVQVQYAQSLDGVTPPSSGWVSDKPTPNMGYWQWQRVRDVFSDGTYGMWVATSVYYGRDAIIVSATEPSPKVDNMLWQKPSDPVVLRWNGSAWVEWGISVNNLVVDNATIENGVFQTIEGVEIKAGTFINEFRYNPTPSPTVWKEGTATIANGKWVTEYQQTGGKQEGIVDYTGTAILNDEAVQFSRKMVAGNGEDSFMQLSALGLTMTYGGRGGTLGYNDLYSLPRRSLTASSGFEQYNTSPSSGNHPTAQRTGRLVQLAGAFKPTKDYPAGAEKVPMCVLPVGYRPITSVNQIVQASGSNMYLLSVQTNGEVWMERHRGDVSGSFDYKTLSAGAWCNIACTFSAADV